MFKYSEGIQDVSSEAIISLYDSVGWSTYTDRPEELARCLTNSAFVVVCRDGEKVIGLARSISDDSAIHYLQDILVDPEYQQHGVGRALLSRCLSRFEHVRTHVILTDNEERQRRFYQSLGYKNTRELKKFPLNCFVKMKGLDLE